MTIVINKNTAILMIYGVSCFVIVKEYKRIMKMLEKRIEEL